MQTTNWHWLAIISALAPATGVAQDVCLNGYELTAIVVLENNIKQAVEAYACRRVFPQDSSVYDLYQLRNKWRQQRKQQKDIRDAVYQRIYGDAWQTKINEWRRSTATNMNKAFIPTGITCQRLREELAAYLGSWETLYNAAARQAATQRYDPLRCPP